MIEKQKILSLIISLVALAYDTYAQNIFRPDSMSIPIKLPEKFTGKHIGNFEIGKRSNYKYILLDSATYYAVFNQYSKDSLPVIDFNNYDLMLAVYCPQCLAHCPGDDPCHRNACHYTKNWFLRKRK